MAAFRHRPLTTPHSIRLLLLGPSLRRDAPLLCSMKTFDLSAGPKYEALSYTWDDQRPSQTILCDGKELLVTSNVESALRHLRRRLHRRWIWIDAICIDQANLQECGKQVSMMHLIYRKATGAIVWLGMGNLETDRAIFALKWLFPFYKFALHLTFTRYWSLKRFMARRQAFQNVLLHGGRSSKEILVQHKDFTPNLSFTGLRHILHHHWFRRIWTLQEISLARRAKIICGNSQIKWSTLNKAVTFDRVILTPEPATPVLMDGGYNPAIPVYQNVPFFHRMQQVQLLREWFRRAKYNQSWPTKCLPIQDQPPFSVIVNLVLTGLNPGYECANPRDRYFGLLGLLSAFGIQLPAPDYGKGLPELIVDSFKAIVEQHNSLDLLLFVSGEHSHNGLPSWIPEYRVVPWWGSDTPLSVLKSGHDLTSAPVFQLVGGKFTVSGVVVDRIEALTEPICFTKGDPEGHTFTTLDMPSKMFLSGVRNWIQFCSHSKSYQETTLHSQDALLFNLFVHPQVVAFYDNAGVPVYDTLGFLEWSQLHYSHRLFAHFRHWLRNVNSFNETLIYANDHVFDQVQHFISSERIMATSPVLDKSVTIGYQRACLVIQRWVRENLFEKRLFRTASGALGIGWQAMRTGDLVVQLKGLASPMMFRRIGEDCGIEAYQVIGPCRIRGTQIATSETVDGKGMRSMRLI